jgi:hypothetical protein
VFAGVITTLWITGTAANVADVNVLGEPFFAQPFPGLVADLAGGRRDCPRVAPRADTMAANAMGVDGGADLLLYLWFIISGLLIFASHLKIRRLGLELTELARCVAIRDAERMGYEAKARVDAAGARKTART